MPIKTSPARALVLLLAACITVPVLSAGPTIITPPQNRFTPEQDVELGLKAAEEIREKYSSTPSPR